MTIPSSWWQSQRQRYILTLVMFFFWSATTDVINAFSMSFPPQTTKTTERSITPFCPYYHSSSSVNLRIMYFSRIVHLRMTKADDDAAAAAAAEDSAPDVVESKDSNNRLPDTEVSTDGRSIENTELTRTAATTTTPSKKRRSNSTKNLLTVPLFLKFVAVLLIKFLTDLIVFPVLFLYRLAHITKQRVLRWFGKTGGGGGRNSRRSGNNDKPNGETTSSSMS